MILYRKKRYIITNDIVQKEKIYNYKWYCTKRKDISLQMILYRKKLIITNDIVQNKLIITNDIVQKEKIYQYKWYCTERN